MTTEAAKTILLFRTGGRLLALPISRVQEVVPAFEILRTPGLASTLAGMINFRGDVLPVIDTSVLFGGDAMVLCPRQQFIIARDARRPVALLVESVEELVEIRDADCIEPMGDGGMRPFTGVIPVEGEMALIVDIDGCIAADPALIPEAFRMDAVHQEGPLS
jgi:purine-binding chemotaxis protein CheW